MVNFEEPKMILLVLLVRVNQSDKKRKISIRTTQIRQSACTQSVPLV